MKKGIGSIALLLLAAILLVSIASCANGEDGISGGADTDGDTGAAETADPNLDADGYLRDTLPADLDLGGEKVTMLIRSLVAATEFYVEEMTGDIVDDALYTRNRCVEERLNADLEFLDLAGEWDQRDSFNSAIRSSVMSNDGLYDIAAVLSNQLSILTLEGLLTNLSNVEYLDFEKPWWADGLLDELAVAGKLYFASGDASLGLINGMMCMFYNKNLAEDYDLEDIYQTVQDGKWTIDALLSMARGTYSDLNGNGKVDREDRYAFCIGDWNQSYGFIEAFELPVTEKDSEGYPSKFVYGGEKVVNAVAKLVSIFKNEEGMAIDSKKGFVNEFAAGQVLFITGEFKDTSVYREVDTFDFGVIPYPKWDEVQKDYHGGVRATYSSFCIPITASDIDAAGAVMEAFASESYRRVSPAYFENALKIKYTRDNESANMFDLIKSSVIFNFAISFTISLNDPQNTFKATVAALNDNWASKYASWEPAAQIALENTIAVLKGLP
jgi:hypothetical protein